MARLTKIQHQDIVDRYQAGELCADLAREFAVDRSSVYSLLKRKGVQMQDKSYVFRKASGHYLDENVFEAITDDSAYWIGFLLADGAIVDTTVALCLQDQDSFHLEKFRQFVGGTQSLIKVESTKSWRYAFQSQKVVDDLGVWGITPRKSSTATVHPFLVMNRHFWRGVIDGDGSLGVYKNHAKTTARLEICGSQDVALKFCYFAKQVFGISINSKTQRNVYRVQVGGHSAATLVNALYENASTALDRKALSAYAVWQWNKER
jgi:DNA-binding transcriptional regulator WhiA